MRKWVCLYDIHTIVSVYVARQVALHAAAEVKGDLSNRPRCCRFSDVAVAGAAGGGPRTGAAVSQRPCKHSPQERDVLRFPQGETSPTRATPACWRPDKHTHTQRHYLPRRNAPLGPSHRRSKRPRWVADHLMPWPQQSPPYLVAQNVVAFVCYLLKVLLLSIHMALRDDVNAGARFCRCLIDFRMMLFRKEGCSHNGLSQLSIIPWDTSHTLNAR